MKNLDKTKRALLFVNGPYQLLAGVACIRRHLSQVAVIDVIPYDMQWQTDLMSATKEYAKILGLKWVDLPLEFKKSDNSNFQTFRIRAFLNHILFYFYTRVFGKKNVFIPKIIGSPERAILLACFDKKVFIYDDGSVIYIDPKLLIRRTDRGIISWILGHTRIEIGIYPINPELLTYESYNGISVSKTDYSEELAELFRFIANYYKKTWQDEFASSEIEKNRMIITLPRLTLAKNDRLGDDIYCLVSGILEEFPHEKIYFKPHPRDGMMEFSFLAGVMSSYGRNCQFLPESLWIQPIEAISAVFSPEIILSGWSTIGINEKLFQGTRVMVFDFLSIDLNYYKDEIYSNLLSIITKAGTYSGKTVNEALTEIKSFLRNP